MTDFRRTDEWLASYQARRAKAFAAATDAVAVDIVSRATVPTLTEAIKPDSENKYHAEKVVNSSGRFASRKEAKRAAQLELLQKSGAIRDLKFQVKFLLIPKQPGERACFYIADATYWGTVTGYTVEDTKSKGTKTPSYRIKKKLMLFVHGIRITEYE